MKPPRNALPAKKGTGPARSPAGAAAHSSLEQAGHSLRHVLIAVIVLAILARVLTVAVSPRYGYTWDHVDVMAWSSYAWQHGPWHIYDMQNTATARVRLPDPRTGELSVATVPVPHACNYPPLSTFIFAAQGLTWALLDPVSAEEAEAAAHSPKGNLLVTPRIMNTIAARAANTLPATVFDFLMAWGIVRLVRVLRSERAPRAELAAFAVALLAPPVFLNAGLWGQMDSWISGLLVWCLYFLLTARPGMGGLIYGAALMTKPQAILFGPVLAFVFFALRFRPGGSWGQALTMVKTALAAMLVVAVVAAPFMLADADDSNNPDGAWRWLQRSYVGTIGAEAYQRTTMRAFNIWWLDFLVQGLPRPPQTWLNLLDDNVVVLGVRKVLWGKVLLGAAVLLAWLLCGLRWRGAPQSWLACAFLVMLAAFVLPTRVHERYIYYALPFLIALAAVDFRAWLAPLLVLMLVGTLEMLAHQWVSESQPGPRALSGLLAALATLTLVYSYLALVPGDKSRVGKQV